MIIAILPAHDEETGIAAAINALRCQTRQADRIIVVSDNSVDDTVDIARGLGVEIIETVDNPHRKAGALCQAIEYAQAQPGDLLLFQDADTQLSPGWIKAALVELKDEKVGAVGAIFRADSDAGWLRRCQAMEWERFRNQIRRTGRTFVLSGTAAMIRQEALEDVRKLTGSYYDCHCIVEDFKLTTDLLRAGWELRSPLGCEVTTETMPTLKELFVQRRRWSLGAMQVVSRTRPTRKTAIYVWQQIMLMVSIAFMLLYFGVTAGLVATGQIGFSLFWACIGLVFMLERVVTVPRHRLFAATILPELIYAIILQASHLAAAVQFLKRSEGQWR